MAILQINLAPGVPSYRQRTILDGVEYVLELLFSQREGRWYLSIRDATGAPLALAIKLVANWPLLYRFRSVVGLPPGELVAADVRPVPVDPTLAELGDVVQLCYIEADT
jgi:hypothetical protein